MYKLLAAAVVVTQAAKLHEEHSLMVAANPIRKVVKMLESLKAKVESEAAAEEAMFKKYMCYCKTSGADLTSSIAAAETKAPEVSAAISESGAKKAQLSEELASHKADREGAKSAVAEATALREKEAAAFAAKKAEYGDNIAAIESAVAALEKGMAGAFVQTRTANTVRKVVLNVDMDDDDRKQVMAFLASGQSSEYAPASGQIVGILKQLMDNMAKGLSEETATENAAVEGFEELMSAKKKEISALTASIEAKSVQAGELAVSIAEMKNDLSDTEAAMAADKKFLEDLTKNCDTKSSDWDEIVKTRSEEVVAISETIKILNDDEALELFKKTLPSAAASFVQIGANSISTRDRALDLIHAAQRMGKSSRPLVDFIALALRGKTVGFEKVISMIDAMVETLKKEQVDDDTKKAYCATEFDTSDDKKKGLELSIKDSETAIGAAEEGIASLSSEIAALEDGIKTLDKSVAKATELRKSEHDEFTQLIAENSAAKDLLDMAKNRLNQFYNPKLHLPPPAFVQVLAHVQLKGAPPPPPEAVGPYSKKTEETSGVIAMIDLLIKDLVKEMTVAESDEKAAQAEYEQMMSDSAAKRAADSTSVSEKAAAKASTEASLQAHKDDKASTTNELLSTLETIKALHSECDWLIQFYDVRKEARASEVDSLGNAKAVLSGSDYSLLETKASNLRGHTKSQ